ncbi:MAG: M14 family metallopeptidase [Bacteroidota bacterium]|nr:M14 family metallopeptidase [Bacteroidota bacterium]
MAPQGRDLRTPYERSGYKATPRYAETVGYLRMLEQFSPMVRITSIGVTPQGREIPLVIVSARKAFTPERAHAAGLPVVLVQSCIHAGEPDGKDASLMLIRDIAVTKSLAGLADRAVLLFLPMMNPDGHERRSPYHRINQNGPEEQGWRTTAQNLNLNRDFMKADAPEMRAWLGMYNSWAPELLIDCHVTDGIDFQYNLTYSMEMYENCPRPVVEWQERLRTAFEREMEGQGDPVFPYVFPREDKDLSKGIMTGAASPRFSTGYAAVRDRAAILIETHMLKPYRDRVTAMYRLLAAVFRFVDRDPNALVDAVRRGEEETIRALSRAPDTVFVPLTFRRTERARPVEFLGYASTVRKSEISGGEYPVWDHGKPLRVTIPFYDDVKPDRLARVPTAYLIPREWTAVIDVLRAHGLRLDRLSSPVRIPVETVVFTRAEWRASPYEGRHPVNTEFRTRTDTIDYDAGTWVLRPAQRGGRTAVHLLEPGGPDSFVQWGFFDTIFEQKEYYEPYVMEEIAARMLAVDTSLRRAFDAHLAADSSFARNPRARLNFFWERSPWYDPKLNVYPVGKYYGTEPLPCTPAPSDGGRRRRR